MHRQAMERMIDDIVSDISRRVQTSPPAPAGEMTADIDTLLCEEDAASRQIMRRILQRLQQAPTAGK